MKTRLNIQLSPIILTILRCLLECQRFRCKRFLDSILNRRKKSDNNNPCRIAPTAACTVIRIGF